FAIDRAGLVGSDGETHQGIFDISYLSTIPNMTVMAPKNKWELSDMLKYAVDFPAPIAIRYPRGEAYDGLREYREPIQHGKSEWIYRENGIVLLALGSMVKTAEKVRNSLKQSGYACSLINARFAKPLDEEMLCGLEEDHTLVVCMEENVKSGGFGEHVAAFYKERESRIFVLPIAIPDEYVEHGKVDILYREVGIDEDTILKRIQERLGQ
ncbi:MAG: transketolase C-terminal domain-containing protein, partial [Roseburia sp.]